MDYETYRRIDPIDPIGKQNELKIYVSYYLGGYNYFTSQKNERGIYVFFIPVSRGNGFESSMLLSDTASAGFKVFVKGLKRKSEKAILLIWNKVEPLADKFAELYNERKFTEICDLAMDCAK